MTRSEYWIQLRIHSPKRYTRLAKASRAKHKDKAKVRTYAWRKKNRARYNEYARMLYHKLKEKLQKVKVNQEKKEKPVRPAKKK